MRFHSAVRMAFRALSRNKLRTALTMLGITIGIGAVICTVSIGQGGQAMIRQQIANLGTDMIWVEAGGRAVNGVRTGNDATKTLTAADAMAIQREIPLITAISPNVDGRIQIAYSHENWNARFRGVSPEYFQIAQWKLATR